MRRLLCLLLIFCFLPAVSLPEEALAVIPPAEEIRPGRAVLISFTAPRSAVVDLVVEDAQGSEISRVVTDYPASAGLNEVWWNGSYGGVLAPAGAARLVLLMDGERAETPVVIGPVAPFLTSIRFSTQLLSAGETLTVAFYASEAGTVTVSWRGAEEWQQLMALPVERGDNYFTWQPQEAVDGDTLLTLMLTSLDGETSSVEQLPLTLTGFALPEEALTEEEEDTEATELASADVAADATWDGEEEAHEVALEPQLAGAATLALDTDQAKYTPTYGSPYAGQDTTLNYWTLPMDITDEAAVWEALMQPITVLDTGKKGAERTQITVRIAPEPTATGIGVVTCVTQGVHVLEEAGEWTKIECYSASFHDSKVKNWNTLIQGWVLSKYVKTSQPSDAMGLVIDKLTQRMYIFRDGKLWDTLLVSTGLANERQPYNETRSGEFLLTSAVGEFKSDNIYCAMAIRFDSGDLIHEVPHKKLSGGGKDYRSNEAKLGVKASHGCIRVQRKTSPSGANMSWLWNNRKKNIRVFIWEDWQGRAIHTPEAETVLYYNPDGGAAYHSAPTCNSAKGVTLTPFTYGELENAPYARLNRCDWCAPPLREAEIAEINAVYAPGGDHDPVMTAAREKAWQTIYGKE